MRKTGITGVDKKGEFEWVEGSMGECLAYNFRRHLRERFATEGANGGSAIVALATIAVVGVVGALQSKESHDVPAQPETGIVSELAPSPTPSGYQESDTELRPYMLPVESATITVPLPVPHPLSGVQP